MNEPHRVHYVRFIGEDGMTACATLIDHVGYITDDPEEVTCETCKGEIR